MLVRDQLKANSKRLVTARPATEILEAMRLLIEHRISCLLITDARDQLAGIVSDKDIFRVCYEKHCDFASMTIGDLMTTNLIVGVETDELSYIAGLMTNNRIRHVPIVDEDRLIGLISIGDVVKAQMANMEVENRYLKQYINGSYPA
jgi:CBS domain-containing protein